MNWISVIQSIPTSWRKEMQTFIAVRSSDMNPPNYSLSHMSARSMVHVPNFGGCQGRRTGVGVTTVSDYLILGGWVTKVLKNGDKK